MKVCPLRMMALESSPQAVRNTGNADEIIEDASAHPAGKKVLRETIGCLGKDCAWWDGEDCAMRDIVFQLKCIGNVIDAIST